MKPNRLVFLIVTSPSGSFFGIKDSKKERTDDTRAAHRTGDAGNSNVLLAHEAAAFCQPA